MPVSALLKNIASCTVGYSQEKRRRYASSQGSTSENKCYVGRVEMHYAAAACALHCMTVSSTLIPSLVGRPTTFVLIMRTHPFLRGQMQ